MNSDNMITRSDSQYSDPAAQQPKALQIAVPKQDLELILDELLKLYTPGDIITGYVSGCNSSEPLTYNHVILSGTAKTYMHTDATQHQDCATLLYQDTYPSVSDEGLVPGFSITIPKTVLPSFQISIPSHLPVNNTRGPPSSQVNRTKANQDIIYHHL
jgi:hypothetical protein